MYVPKHFAETDPSVLKALIKERPLGAWVNHGCDELIVNHIPFHFDSDAGEYGTLIGHVARANPVWKSLSSTHPSVVIFQGEQAYISPSWYPSKHEDSRTVPTWNYVVAHAHGYPRVVEDRARLLAIVSKMTEIHESNQTVPWNISDAPPEFIDTLLGAIIGIEIPLTKLTGKWKVSQNRTLQDKLGTVAGLQAMGNAEAKGMAQQVIRFARD